MHCCHIHTPGPALSCRGQPSPGTLPPSVQHMLQIGPPWCNLSQRRPLLHGHPNHHMCQQWFYVPSGQHRPVVTAGYIIVTSLLKSQPQIWPSDTYLWSPDNKTPTGLQVVNGVIIQIDAGDHSFDNFLLQGFSHLLQANVLIMLDRDDNCVHTHWQHGTAVLAVLDSDLRTEYIWIYKNPAAYFMWLAIWWEVWQIYLRLRVWPEPWKSAVSTQLGHLGIQLVCKDNSERHAFLCLIGRIAKHQTLQWKKSSIIYYHDSYVKTNLTKDRPGPLLQYPLHCDQHEHLEQYREIVAPRPLKHCRSCSQNLQKEAAQISIFKHC